MWRISATPCLLSAMPESHVGAVAVDAERHCLAPIPFSYLVSMCASSRIRRVRSLEARQDHPARLLGRIVETDVRARRDEFRVPPSPRRQAAMTSEIDSALRCLTAGLDRHQLLQRLEVGTSLLLHARQPGRRRPGQQWRQARALSQRVSAIDASLHPSVAGV